MSKSEDPTRGHAALRQVQASLAEHARSRELIHELQEQRAELRRQRAKLLAAQAELDTQRHRYGELFDFAPIGYLSIDGTGIIRSVNVAGVGLLGMERKRLVGLPLLGRVAPGDRRRLLDHLRRCRKGLETVTIDLEVVRPDGRSIPVQLLSRRGAVGTEEGLILCALVDMTEREQAFADRRRIEADRQRIEREHALARAESEAKDRFLAVLSHELRNPLSPIVYMVETLERGLVPPERMASALALIRRNLDLEVRLIDDLLDVSRIAHGKLVLERRAVDLHDVVRDVADGAAPDLRRADLTLAVELDATRHRLDGDPARLRQVVWNLVTNAIRNTPAGGRITVRTQDRDACIALTVRDTGRGLPSDRLETIFRPFDQVDPPGRRRGGLGLGLPISRGLVEAHGGRLSVASEGPGRGATFTVLLPTATEVQPDEAPPGETALPARALRILVVEDDADSAEALATVLSLRGHDVVMAHTLADGLACGRNGFDVVVSDIGLPDGSGTDLIAALRQRGDVRGIAISGFGTPEDVRQSLMAGFERHLTKPVHLDELLQVIESLGG